MIRKASEGQQYRCVKSSSCAYTEGVVYDVVIENERKYLRADDGLLDLTSLLVSTFELVEPVENTEE